MEVSKYYDYKKNRPIDIEKDGCDWENWEQLFNQVSFANHPKGFKVFLAPEKIISFDEYADSDPYIVEKEINSKFHQRRIQLTVELARRAINSIDGTPKILDLGCGQGHITEMMRQSLKTPEFTGLDYSISAIEYAHEHFQGIDFSVGNVYDKLFTENYFDVVICNNLWEHVPDPLYLLKRIKTFLKPSGYLIISTPSRYRFGNLGRILLGKPIRFMSQHHVTEYTIGQVIEQLKYGGFSIIEIESKPISSENMIFELAKKLFYLYISLLGSHHRLESTVFYLAKEITNDDIKRY